jgi:hypothetical protein
MEERRVGRAQRERDRRVRLMAGRRDRVEAPPRGAEFAGREVAEAAADLRPPDRLRLRRGIAAPAAEGAQRIDEVLLERIEAHDQNVQRGS